jgi:succinate dehydrogenase/fumarate reductase flavoprotein subunit|tara:strand:+ start:87 stop:296 length:210 start_codon:yes stop_codon:yes gene_type:complete
MWGLSSLNILAAASVTPLHYDLVVVGGGSAGLTAAKFAARFKKSVLLVEKAQSLTLSLTLTLPNPCSKP